MSMVYQFNRTEEEQREKTPPAEAASRSIGSSISNSSTTTVEKPPYFDKDTRQMLAMESIKEEFRAVFDREMPRAIRENVLCDLRCGTPAYYYRYAIEQTMYAPRPSWRYTMAIVARLKRTKATQADIDDSPL